jgi:hypothetical protein
VSLSSVCTDPKQLQFYLDARRQIAAFHQRYQEAIQHGWLQDDAISDIEIKEFEMIQFDLEALMRLENWQDLDKVLTVHSPCHAEPTHADIQYRCVSKPATKIDSKALRT